MIVLFTVAILSVSALSNNAYAGGLDRGMTLSAEGSGSTIAVSGDTDRNDFDVTVIVTASNGNKVVIDQLSVVGSSFSTSINVSALDDGTYTIAVSQGQSSRYNLSVDIEVSGGTSDSSVSTGNVTDKDEESYVLSENAPTTASLKKLTITASGMEGSTTIDVSGTTDRSDEIIIKVTAPNGNLVSVDQITPSGGSYYTTIETGGALWSQDGMYMITASQTSDGLKASTETFSRAADSDSAGLINYQASAEVEILDGHVVPEFGVIAAMILAVAIVSIIVVTAKTKLSIVPRY
jgi:predicted secreted protein with PEFG-CTERM motif